MPSTRRAVGNTMNTQGDCWHDRHADDRLVYSPYNGDVLSPGKCPLCNTLVAAAVLTTLVVWVTGKYYVRQKLSKLEPLDAATCMTRGDCIIL